MKAHEYHNNASYKRSLAPVAIGTTGTGKTGKPIDRQGFDAVELLFEYGTITATNAVITATVFEGDVTGTMTSVADADLIGTEANASIAAASTRTSDVSKNVIKKIGYKGTKRYVSGKVVSTVTAGPPVSVAVGLFNPEMVPTI